jgi:hypothetical protein
MIGRRRLTATLSLIGLIAASCARAQPPTNPSSAPKAALPIGSIDFYGLRRLTAEQLRSSVTFKVGDPITPGDRSFTAASQQRLMRVPGVLRVHFDVICCTDGLPAVFVGIEEDNASVMHFRPAPSGSIRLPPDVVQTGSEFYQAMMKAVLSGHAQEDDSQGHALLDTAAARPVEDRMIAIARRDLTLLREVLRESGDPGQRALAAQLLGYASDLQAVVPDLVYGMSDSDGDVRNNAMRALMVFTMARKVKAPKVPYRPFIALLNSPVWTDLNKSSAALMRMARARDPALLSVLRGQALPSLVEMARWNDRGHAEAAFWILGDIGGLDEQVIQSYWNRNLREPVIRAARLGPKRD